MVGWAGNTVIRITLQAYEKIVTFSTSRLSRSRLGSRLNINCTDDGFTENP
jgi:hypothetical protein